MPSIENRIVQMQFDNAAFEQRLTDTLRSLDKLNQTISNVGAQNGLASISDSVRGFNLGPISTAIDGVSAKFLALSTIAVTVLSTITSRAIDAGTRIVSALSFDPLRTGFEEYQTQIGSIQTILANTDSKGTTLDQVNRALDQLNEYSDKTIYNFTEMTRNIGTFTAAGVDLDKSVLSIKGIANLAAISGSNSQQASSAMYQLSQAIAAGSVKLMDWNSIVNAGMGGEVFQRALFETGKAMGTIADVPVGQSFEEWTEAGNSFRGSLESGWLTADVLTQTLAAFTGELDAAQLQAMGYTEAQAQELARMGELGVESATKVRTLKALIDTTKEALASGWSQSFRLIFGDFEAATELFTGISDALGGFISRSSEARNEMLKTWSDFGARTTLIESLKEAFQALGDIIRPIKEAFQNIFPPLTAERLIVMTAAFADLVDKMKPSEETIDRVYRIFNGLFGALDIGWNVIKEGARFISDLLTSFGGAGSGQFLEFVAKIGDFFADLSEKLVVSGRISQFFDNLTAKIPVAIAKFNEIKDAVIEFFLQAREKLEPIVGVFDTVIEKIGGFFEALGGGAINTASEATDRLSQRFETLRSLGEKLANLWEPLKTAFDKVVDVLEEIWLHIETWFGELGAKLKAAIGPGDFDAVVDAVNVGLLGGIAAILTKFLKNGFKFDLGDGLFSAVTQSFEQLTGVLSAMQTQIKADALLKIAIAVGVLTASVLVLSLIDSAALTKALTAMAIGFGQLLGAFALLTKLAIGPTTAAKVGIISASLIALGAAMLILSLAVKVLSTMGWEELGKGLAGVAALLVMVTAIAGPLGNASGGMIRAGIAMGIMGASLLILAAAVKAFSMFSWADMAKGFVGVAGGLLIMAAAMHLMPANMPVTAAGLVLVAAAMNILASAIQQFASMTWGEMARGAAALAGGLLIIAGAMHLMPPNLPLTAVGLIAVSVAMNILAQALQSFGGMSWGEIARGLAAMGASLLILAVGAMAMSGAMAGAVAVTVMAGGLTILVQVIKELAKIKIADLVKALVGLAGIFAILGLAAALLAPITPALLGLGAALVLVGAGFALFGAGAALIAIAFERVAAAGEEGLGVLIGVLDIVIDKLPELIQAFALGLVELGKTILDAAPVLIDSLAVLLEHIISSLIELVPKLGELIGSLLTELISLLRTYIPQFISLGLELLGSLLGGIRDNIYQITELAVQIIANFLRGIADNLGSIISAAVDLIASFINGIAANIWQIIDAGVNLLISFLSGIGDNIYRVADAVGELITEFIDAVANLGVDITSAGLDALITFLDGITDNLNRVSRAVVTMIIKFVTTLGENVKSFVGAGAYVLVNFLDGIVDNLIFVTSAVVRMINRFIRAIGDNASSIVSTGAYTLIKFLDGIAENIVWVAHEAARIIIALINGLADAVDEYAPYIRNAGARLAWELIDAASFGIAGGAGELAGAVGDAFGGAIDWGRKILGIGGPSKVFCDIGKTIVDGAAAGILSNTSAVRAIDEQSGYMISAMEKSLRAAVENMEDMHELNPVVTPVLDLSSVQNDAKSLSTLLGDQTVGGASLLQANTLSALQTAQAQATASEQTTQPSEIRFEQNIYAPEQLSMGDIYKQTRTQLVMAKEEFDIP